MHRLDSDMVLAATPILTPEGSSVVTPNEQRLVPNVSLRGPGSCRPSASREAKTSHSTMNMDLVALRLKGICVTVENIKTKTLVP